MRGPPRISLRSSSRICAGSKREAKIGARFVNHAPEARAPNLPSEMKHPDIARQLGRDLKGVAFPTVVPTRLTCDQAVTCLHGCPRCRKTKHTGNLHRLTENLTALFPDALHRGFDVIHPDDDGRVLRRPVGLLWEKSAIDSAGGSTRLYIRLGRSDEYVVAHVRAEHHDAMRLLSSAGISK